MNETALRIPTNQIQGLTTEGGAYVILANRGLKIPRAFPSTFQLFFIHKKGESRGRKNAIHKNLPQQDCFYGCFQRLLY